MSDNNEVQTKFTADITSLLSGMGKAQDSVKEATEGMTSNISKLAETFEKMGAAAISLAAVGLAFEGIKKGVEYVEEAVEKTKELSEAFFNLGYATGATRDQMNQYTAAIEMSGGSTETMQSLLVGMQRGIKANSDVLIANGVAANQAALNGLSFEEYLKRVHEIAEKMATPTEREQFLIMALGRGGAMAGAMLGEFVENMEKAKGTQIITDQSMAQLKETKESIGALKIAQQEYAATVSGSATPIANFFRDLHTHYLQAINDSNRAMQAYQAERALLSGADAGREVMHSKGMSGSTEGPGGQSLVTKKNLEEQKAAAAEAERLRKEAEAEEHDENSRRVAELLWEDNFRKQMLAQRLANEQLAAKQFAEASKESYREIVAQAKDALTEQRADLDQKVAFGQITGAQEIAQRKALIDKEMDIVLAAKDAEIAAVSAKDADYINKIQKLSNEGLDIQRKAIAQKAELDRQAAAKQMATYDQVFQAMTSGFASSITGLIKGTMSWGQAIQNVASSALDAMINMFVQIGLKQAETWLAGMLFAAPMNAATAAGAAFASTCAIPIVGPEMAPAVAAESYAQALAAGVSSAAGGWDRVPADQIAQIHKNEMILPASLAEGVRKNLGDGNVKGNGNGGGDHFHFHNHAVDAKGFEAMINRNDNQGALIRSMREAMRNGRMA